MRIRELLGSHRGDALAVLALLALSLLFVGLHLNRYQVLGPFDEVQHVDYVYSLRGGELPRYGDQLSDQALDDLLCRGSDNAIEVRPPDCDRPMPARPDLPAGGHAYEAGQQPVYYLVTAAVDGLVGALDPGWGRIGVMRASGALWLAAGALALYAALRWLRRSVGVALAASAVAMTVPGILFGAATVSNDIATWFVGALALLGVVAWAKRWLPSRAWGKAALALGALGVFAGMVKTTTLLAMLLASGVMLLMVWEGPRPRSKRAVLAALAPTAACLLAIVVWGLVVMVRQLQPTDQLLPFSAYQADGIPFDTVVLGFWNMFPPLASQYLPPFLNQSAFLGWTSVATRIVQFGVLCLPFLTRPKDLDEPDRAIGIGFLVTLVLSAPYYVALFYLTTHQDLPGQPRFSFPLVPFFLAMATGWVPAGWRRWTVLAVLGLPGVAVLWLLATGGHPSPAG